MSKISPKLLLTAALCCGFVAIGMVLASLGPSQLELARNANVSLSSISFLFTSRSVGYLVGSTGGVLFDKFNGNRITGIALLVTGAASVCIPFLQKLPLLGTVTFFQGTSMGLLDSGGNLLLLRTFSTDVGPYLQALHAAFGVGTLLAPLILSAVLQRTGGIAAAYVTYAIVCGAVGCSMWVLPAPPPPSENAEGHHGKELPKTYTWRIVILCAIFLCIYVGCEVTAGAYFAPYGVKALHLSEPVAVNIASCFWGSFTAGRLIAIPLSMRVSPSKLLIGDLIGSVIAATIFFAFQKVEFMVWISAALLGASFASAFPAAFHLAESYIELRGVYATCFVVGASFGEMVVPLLTGQLFSRISPASFPAIIFFLQLLTALCLALLLRFGIPRNMPAEEPVEAELEGTTNDIIPLYPEILKEDTEVNE
eukprot:TRINITY_DN8542_c0_g1_i1.p1 TRINITY_DN8542_c0_g1~~TRINITY_DN8542_c0_g1_i1.p1  ORF type:complete len:424 (+),score=54.26 TRINITY_DN8542_c0_g1_i1:20-1291(+)